LIAFAPSNPQSRLFRSRLAEEVGAESHHLGQLGQRLLLEQSDSEESQLLREAAVEFLEGVVHLWEFEVVQCHRRQWVCREAEEVRGHVQLATSGAGQHAYPSEDGEDFGDRDIRETLYQHSPLLVRQGKDIFSSRKIVLFCWQRLQLLSAENTILL
jgi:hypothetical protein